MTIDDLQVANALRDRDLKITGANRQTEGAKRVSFVKLDENSELRGLCRRLL